MATEVRHKHIVPQGKLEEVEQLKDLINKYNVICLAKMDKLGARQLQFIRKKLVGTIFIRMSKNRLFKIAALQSNKKNIKTFIDEIDGSTSYIFTDMNPFKLKLFLDKNKVNAPAKVGDMAPKDIVVNEGNTGFPPGPMISEFKEVGIDSMVKGGSIYIKKDVVVAKKGEEISRMLALVLSRLNLNPMEIGLNLYSAFDDGIILKDADLNISVESTLTQLKTAISNAINLSIEVAYPTKENITFIIQKAVLAAKGLVLTAGIISKDTIPDLLTKAYATALSLSIMINRVDPKALPSDLKQKIEVKGISDKKPEKPEKKEEKAEEKK
jgi:large subunit ribosomal protein L10